MGQNSALFKGPYKPLGEVQISRILTNRDLIGHILHTNQKGRFYGVFRYLQIYHEGKRSPYRAYFTHFVHRR